MSPATHRRISGTDKSSRQQSCVRFKVHYEAVFGESIYVLGSISILGCWRIESALRMNWTEVTYSISFKIGLIFKRDLKGRTFKLNTIFLKGLG